MAPNESDDSSRFLESDFELIEAFHNILKNTIKSSPEKKKELLKLIKETVEQINIDALDLSIIDENGSEKAVKREDFIKLIDTALDNLESKGIDPKIIKLALRCIYNNPALIDNTNKDNLNKLTDALKTLHTNQERGVDLDKALPTNQEKGADLNEGNVSTSEKIILVAGVVILSPIIALAILVVLLILGAFFAGKGIKIAGEKIKEGVIKAEQGIKSLTNAENNFSKFEKFLEAKTQDLSNIQGMSEESFVIVLKKQLGDVKKIREMLQSEMGPKAMEGLIQDKVIRNFSREDMRELVEKGKSIDQADFEIFAERMSMLYDQISLIIEVVEEKFHKKIKEMSPSNQLSSPGVSQSQGPGLENT